MPIIMTPYMELYPVKPLQKEEIDVYLYSLEIIFSYPIKDETKYN